MATIIVIDDSATVRTQVKQCLESAGHKVIEADCGADGLAKIVAAKTPDLVITDYNMPGLDGIAMLSKVKEQMGATKFPIFMLTTETSDALKAAGKEVGVMAWINKPFVPEKLLGAISKVLAMKAAA
jgi:two-component system chemotaxis response regulator CheY